ncbi:hypothetical protein L1887_55077 [Cichorium endivia]|nr:hypothetical protein L1887_55077 [Cichorium endivia]
MSSPWLSARMRSIPPRTTMRGPTPPHRRVSRSVVASRRFKQLPRPDGVDDPWSDRQPSASSGQLRARKSFLTPSRAEVVDRHPLRSPSPGQAERAARSNEKTIGSGSRVERPSATVLQVYSAELLPVRNTAGHQILPPLPTARRRRSQQGPASNPRSASLKTGSDSNLRPRNAPNLHLHLHPLRKKGRWAMDRCCARRIACGPAIPCRSRKSIYVPRGQLQASAAERKHQVMHTKQGRRRSYAGVCTKGGRGPAHRYAGRRVGARLAGEVRIRWRPSCRKRTKPIPKRRLEPRSPELARSRA